MKHRKSAYIFYSLLVSTCIMACFNYYQFDAKLFRGISDHSDITSSYVNSKYFNELGYFELYPAMLIADHESSNQLSNIRKYRDLHTYKVTTVDHASLSEKGVKSRFSSKRWNNFKHDVDYLLKNNIDGGWSCFFVGHGYNPPPPWTLIGGTLSNLVPVEHLKSIALIDLLLIIFMFTVIVRTFGVDVGLFGILFFCCTFSGRSPILGNSLLRFDWLVALSLAICALKSRRHATAGVLIMYSSLSRVFPAIFFWPYVIFAIYQLKTTKEFPKNVLRFAISACALFITTLVLLLTFLGTESIAESKANLAMQASPESYSSHRVGLADALFYRGEITPQDLRDNGGILAKAHTIKKHALLIYGLGFVALALIALYVPLAKRPVFALIPLAILPFFCFLTPPINYYNLRLLLIMYHASDIRRFRNALCLVLLFAIEVVTQWSHVIGNWRYATTCITSIGLLIYFCTLTSLLLYDISLRLPFVDTTITRLRNYMKSFTETSHDSGSLMSLFRTGSFITCITCFVFAPVLYLSNQPRVTPQQRMKRLKNYQVADTSPASTLNINHNSIASRKPPGTKWSTPGNITFSQGSVSIHIEPRSKATRIELGLDNNDAYRIDLISNKQIVTSLYAKKKRRKDGGTSIHTLAVPSHALEKGYDTIKITPTSGDDRYSISHVILLDN